MADPLDKRYAKYKEPFMKPVCGGIMVRIELLLYLRLMSSADFRCCPGSGKWAWSES